MYDCLILNRTLHQQSFIRCHMLVLFSGFQIYIYTITLSRDDLKWEDFDVLKVFFCLHQVMANLDHVISVKIQHSEFRIFVVYILHLPFSNSLCNMTVRELEDYTPVSKFHFEFSAFKWTC